MYEGSALCWISKWFYFEILIYNFSPRLEIELFWDIGIFSGYEDNNKNQLVSIVLI
ncbi:MAG: hypothetical protein ACPK85_01260 [Methanosarcina sp.]